MLPVDIILRFLEFLYKNTDAIILSEILSIKYPLDGNTYLISIFSNISHIFFKQ
jgi:hypothetical protein